MRFPQLLLVLVSLSTATVSFGAVWTSGGPEGGPVNALVAAPSDALVVYAGTANGVYRSVDTGITWKRRADTIRDVRSIVVHPFDPSVLFAMHGLPSAISRSNDGGATWQRLNLPAEARPTALVMAADNPSHLFVGSDCQPFFKVEPQYHEAAGLFRSTDDGASWTHIPLTGLPSHEACVTSLAIDPASPSTLYANSTLRSDDRGLTWTKSADRVPGHRVVVDPTDGARRFAIRSDATPLRILVSDDRGLTWREVAPLGIAAIHKRPSRPTALAIDPSTARLFLGSEAGLYRSGDGGRSWLPLDGPAREPITALAYDPVATALIIGTPSGSYRSEQYPWNDWRQLTLGDSSLSTGLVAHPTESHTLFANAFRHLYRTTDAGRSWQRFGPPLEITESELPYIGSVAVTTNGDVYAQTHNGGSINRLQKLEMGSAVWEPLNPPRSPFETQGAVISFVTADPSIDDLIFVGQLTAIARSRDGGVTWEQIALPPGAYPRTMAIDPTDSNRIYLSTAEGLLTSVDGGRTWTPRAPDYFAISQIVISPADAATLYVQARERQTLDFILARSTDGGVSWSRIPSPVPSPATSVTALAADPRRSRTLYAATLHEGVFRTDDGTSRNAVENSPRRILALAIDRSGLALHASVINGGVWEYPLIATRTRPVRR